MYTDRPKINGYVIQAMALPSLNTLDKLQETWLPHVQTRGYPVKTCIYVSSSPMSWNRGCLCAFWEKLGSCPHWLSNWCQEQGFSQPWQWKETTGFYSKELQQGNGLPIPFPTEFPTFFFLNPLFVLFHYVPSNFFSDDSSRSIQLSAAIRKQTMQIKFACFVSKKAK